MKEDRQLRLRWLTQAVDQSPASIMITDLQGRIEYVNAMFTEITGYSEDEAIGRTAALIKSGKTPPDVYESLWITLREGAIWVGEIQNRRKNGELYWDHVRICPVRGPDGTIEHYLSVQEDVTRRKEAEQAVRESEERFRQFAENVQEAFWLFEAGTGRMLYVNSTFLDIWGYEPEELQELTEQPDLWLQRVHPEDRPGLRSAMERVDTGKPSTDVFRVVRPDGSICWVRARAFPILDEEGELRRVVGLSEDITEQRETELRLEQAQRMEAVGRLAGGIAHDFNNLLTVILAEAQLMREDLSPEGPAMASLQEIVKAGERASVLTRKMLAFSRRQLIEPTVFPLNDLVREMETMLRRTVGEDVRLSTRLAPDAGRVEADRGQIEQVLVNLIVNARDAMPRGGKLAIETANVELDEEYAGTREEVTPGEYVKLSVSDTGEGMTEEVRRKAFDPFFTTKDPGKGTGLGLATSYGIVKQSGGHIAVYSEPGLGTTVNVYLPRSRAAADNDEGARPAEVPGGDETILVVEDEAAVRKVACRALGGIGYTVLEARDATAALEVIERHEGPIALLFTDVVLPGMSGRELAERIEESRPDIRILFTTGYTNDVVLQHRLIVDSYELLQKPFTVDSLLRKVREVLDRSDAGESPIAD